MSAARAGNSRIGSELPDARRMLRRPVGHKWSYRQITAAAEALIGHFAEAANGYPDSRLLYSG